MLINPSPRGVSRRHTRAIKSALRAVLDANDDTTVTVTELTCLEEGCAPVETVIALLRSGNPPQQHKLHKAASDVNAEDLGEVCSSWGLNVTISTLASLLQESLGEHRQ
ncbi:MAG: hypothetical protein AAFX85_12495 [Pseudomonadota bacterium]